METLPSGRRAPTHLAGEWRTMTSPSHVAAMAFFGAAPWMVVFAVRLLGSPSWFDAAMWGVAAAVLCYGLIIRDYLNRLRLITQSFERWEKENG